jgi:proline dehydrogenase
MTTAAVLSRERYDTTVDVLGEDIRTSNQASATVSEYLELLSRLSRDEHPMNVSLKLSALGLCQDGDACRRNLEIICRVADARRVAIHIDMEQSAYTDQTLQIYQALKTRYPLLGMTLQARLRRTLDDARWAAEMRATVRLCKGIYIEPQSIAYSDPDEIRSAYLAALKILLTGGSYVEIATHDRRLLQSAAAMVCELGISPDNYEFQMLLGVTRDGADLLRGGHRVRI